MNMMMANENAVGRFEIPVNDMERAIIFYEKVFNTKLERHKMGELDMARFPSVSNGSGAMGSLVYHPEFYKPVEIRPNVYGVLIYFTAQSGDLNNEISKVEEIGGRIVVPKTMIAEDIGYMAVFLDSEGNRIAIHSRK